MTTAQELLNDITSGQYDEILSRLYSPLQIDFQRKRYASAIREFEALYGEGRELDIFSAPGRTEIGGNHTDHQHGRVLAASVNLDIICIVSPNDENIIRVKSEGYPQDVVALHDLACKAEETNKAISLLRGIAYRFQELGHRIGGFDAYTTSNVLKGSGLSSSAAFEVALGVILNHLYNNGTISAVEIAQIGQYSENHFYKKPSGLMDQTASSVGSFVAIDFADPANPVVEAIDFDFARSGYSLCIVDAKGNHSDLTDEYAAIPIEMKKVSGFFGKEFLREVDEAEFYRRLADVREACGDRPVLRAMHFFDDNSRVPRQSAALRNGDFSEFLQLVIASGHSSFAHLQNVFASSQPQEQGLSLALAVSERLLAGKGAWRVHGGGFAGTIQAFVPSYMLEEYRSRMCAIFGQDCCYVLNIRPVGGVKITK